MRGLAIRPFNVIQGLTAVEVYVPVYRGDEFLGTFGGVYSCERLLRHAISPDIGSAYQLSLIGGSGDIVIALPADEPLNSSLSETILLDPPGYKLALRLNGYDYDSWNWTMKILFALCFALAVGMAWGMWALKHDITIRKQTEVELEKARDDLEQRVKERTEERARRHQAELAHVSRLSTVGQMASGLAHELNQPLTAIVSAIGGCTRMIKSSAGVENVEELCEAMEDTPRHERTLTIHASSIEDNRIEVIVRDTGKGLHAETIEQVFEPFYTTKPEGLGIGLAISRSIIEAHNGHLVATANPTGEMAFRFTLPAKGNGQAQCVGRR